MFSLGKGKGRHGSDLLFPKELSPQGYNKSRVDGVVVKSLYIVLSLQLESN